MEVEVKYKNKIYPIEDFLDKAKKEKIGNYEFIDFSPARNPLNRLAAKYYDADKELLFKKKMNIIDGFVPLTFLGENSYANVGLSHEYFHGRLFQDSRFQPDHKTVGLTDSSAHYMHTRSINGEELLYFLNIQRRELKKMLLAIKKRKINLILIGAGGSGSNFLYWTYKLAEIVDVIHIFKHLTIYDHDSFETDNLPRIPYLPIEKEKVHGIPSPILSTLSFSVKKYAIHYHIDNVRSDNIIVGAPDMDTRLHFKNKNTNWIAITHKDDNIRVAVNPPTTDGFLVETYGKIKLPIFFINQMFATLRLLQYLSSISDEELSMLKNLKTEDIGFNLVDSKNIVPSTNFADHKIKDISFARKYNIVIPTKTFFIRGW